MTRTWILILRIGQFIVRYYNQIDSCRAVSLYGSVTSGFKTCSRSVNLNGMFMLPFFHSFFFFLQLLKYLRQKTDIACGHTRHLKENFDLVQVTVSGCSRGQWASCLVEGLGHTSFVFYVLGSMSNLIAAVAVLVAACFPYGVCFISNGRGLALSSVSIFFFSQEKKNLEVMATLILTRNCNLV